MRYFCHKSICPTTVSLLLFSVVMAAISVSIITFLNSFIVLVTFMFTFLRFPNYSRVAYCFPILTKTSSRAVLSIFLNNFVAPVVVVSCIWCIILSIIVI